MRTLGAASCLDGFTPESVYKMVLARNHCICPFTPTQTSICSSFNKPCLPYTHTPKFNPCRRQAVPKLPHATAMSNKVFAAQKPVISRE